MGQMPVHIELSDVAARLALTILAGLAIGYNRDLHGKAAGLRTTLLVCLAACVAMIQVNLLLPTVGKQSDSFITNDLFRLPLGILSGMGFIGAGAILRRENAVSGLTTAATLWFVTVVGLCFGGGQLVLGCIATVIGLVILWWLKHLEQVFRQEHLATLQLDVDENHLPEDEIRQRLQESGLNIRATRVVLADGASEFYFELNHFRPTADTRTPDIVRKLSQIDGVRRTEWKTQV